MTDRRVVQLGNKLDEARQYLDMLGDPKCEVTAPCDICCVIAALADARNLAERLHAIITQADSERHSGSQKKAGKQ